MGEDIPLLHSPDITSKQVKLMYTGDMVSIIEKSKERQQIDTSRCFLYYWYKVKLANGTRGWIYGQYIYPLSGMIEKSRIQTFNSNSSEFQFLIFNEECYSSEMPNDDCYSFPCFYNTKERKIYPIFYSMGTQEALPRRDEFKGQYIFYTMIGNTFMTENIHEEISGSLSTALQIKVRYSMQVGGGSYIMIVEKQDNAFYLTEVRDKEESTGLDK